MSLKRIQYEIHKKIVSISIITWHKIIEHADKVNIMNWWTVDMYTYFHLSFIFYMYINRNVTHISICEFDLYLLISTYYICTVTSHYAVIGVYSSFVLHDHFMFRRKRIEHIVYCFKYSTILQILPVKF